MTPIFYRKEFHIKKYLRTVLLLTVCALLISLQAFVSDILDPKVITLCPNGCKTFRNIQCQIGFYTVIKKHTFPTANGGTGACSCFETRSAHTGYCVVCGNFAVVGNHVHQHCRGCDGADHKSSGRMASAEYCGILTISGLHIYNAVYIDI